MPVSRTTHRLLRALPMLVMPLVTARCATYVSGDSDPDSGISDPFDSSVQPDVGSGPKTDSGTKTDTGTTAIDASSDADAKVSSDASDAFVVPQGACPVGFKQVGEYGTWGGKVNVHRPAGGAWSVDSDCSSGANVNTVAYCQKFWPAVTSQVHLMMVSNEQKPFTQGGGTAPTCGGLALNVGIDQYACCAP